MSIAVLNQVYDEVRRLAIAGSDLAAGDFRLKKLIAPLEASAKKAPVFGKVAEAIQAVIDSTKNNSAEALLNLTTLTTAILYTQGETGATGKLTKIKSTDMGLTISNTSARVLKPLIEALSTTGSGRYELIKDAHERGAFQDLRLVKYAVGAINDKYGEIADYVSEKVLPIYGKAIYPQVREDFNPKGKGDDGRRLKLLHKLNPEATKEIVDGVLEEGSKEVKLAAIDCLLGRADAVEYLLDQAQSKTKDVRSAALKALAPIDDPAVVDMLTTALSGKDVALVAFHIAENKNTQIREFVVAEAQRQLAELLGDNKPAKGKKTADKSLINYFYALLQAFRGRTDTTAADFLLTCFQRQDEIQKLKAAYVDGDEVNVRVAEMMLLSGSKATLKKLVETGANVTPQVLQYTFLATCQLKSPQEVYDTFVATYKNRPKGKTKADQAARELSEQLRSTVGASAGRDRYYYHDYDFEYASMQKMYRDVKLDPRWLDAALEMKDLDVIIALAVPKHAALEKFYSDYMDAELKRKTSTSNYLVDDVLQSMIEVEHPAAVETFVTFYARASKSSSNWLCYYLTRLIPSLPASAIEPLQAMIPDVNERFLDAFVGALDDLKQKHKPQ